MAGGPSGRDWSGRNSLAAPWFNFLGGDNVGRLAKSMMVRRPLPFGLVAPIAVGPVLMWAPYLIRRREKNACAREMVRKT